ncbi:ABC transporter ATP-binding protein [Lachnospiraceae bacterium MD1]|uniref:ABC transporter ATP-binding protein n=1 Tax=Variimorphobacter saccharofermentans TaxID=2755051 RepID=A0A839JZL0_9FIRM|nr:ABC transporter ATP-binding protein [Variimorphobacter saccharofermentans]MBB2182840.1 ABC transporter ATP-binding protein [Variimorphobacter saccharofermentans]
MKIGNAIEVNNVKKKFKVYYDKGRSLKEKVLFRNRNRYEVRWVLNGISFEVKKGEAIGLIGQNGCGKSTTLKLLTRIMYPDEGSIEMKGRVSSLIELGAGFHPDMSGRENIYTNASIFGLTKKEIDDRMKDIIEFSELEEYLDNPVRTYSSGMYMRLAFSVAINVDADILLIDEILAVGDTNFQAKCFNKLREMKSKGMTIVIVSHSLSQIEQICDRTIWIQEGLIRSEGTPRTVHPEYMDFMGQKRQENIEKLEKKNIINKSNDEKNDNKKVVDKNSSDADEVNNLSKDDQNISENKRWGNGKARISAIRTINSEKKHQMVFASGEAFILQIDYNVHETVKDAVFGIAIYRSDGIHCYGVNTKIDNLDEFDLIRSGTAEIRFHDFNLLPGEYYIDVAIESDNGTPVDYYKQAHKVQVYSSINDVGIVRLNHEWNIHT